MEVKIMTTINYLDKDEMLDSVGMLESTHKARIKRDGSRKIEPWTLSIRDILDFVPVSNDTIYRWVKIGYFPKHIDKCANGKKVWRMSEVIDFLNKCIANDNSYDDHMKTIARLK